MTEIQWRDFIGKEEKKLEEKVVFTAFVVGAMQVSDDDVLRDSNSYDHVMHVGYGQFLAWDEESEFPHVYLGYYEGEESE